MDLKRYCAAAAALMVIGIGAPTAVLGEISPAGVTAEAAEYYYRLNRKGTVKGYMENDGTLYITGSGNITYSAGIFGQDRHRIRSVVFDKKANVKTIAECAFKDCTALESIVLPSTVEEIHRAAFSGCTSLQKIEIPAGCTSISDEAFSGCTSLGKVRFMTKDPITFGVSAFDGLGDNITVEIPIGSEYADREILDRLKDGKFPKVFGNAWVVRKDTPDQRVTPHVVSDNGRIILNWNGSPRASYYNVYLVRNDGTLARVKTTTDTKAVFRGKVNGRYSITIRARINGKWTYVTDREIVTILA